MNEYLNGDQLCDLFFNWMKEKFGVEEEDRFYILLDFVAPDECLWLIPEYLDDVEINGKAYCTTRYTTDFSAFATFSNAYKFSFYEYDPVDGGAKLYRIKGAVK